MSRKCTSEKLIDFLFSLALGIVGDEGMEDHSPVVRTTLVHFFTQVALMSMTIIMHPGEGFSRELDTAKTTVIPLEELNDI